MIKRLIIVLPLAACLLAAFVAPFASADITDWANEVSLGTPVRYVDASPVNNSNVDIGPNQSPQHATYEFIVNTGNYNGGAGPAVLRIGGVTGTPAGARPRHAAGGTAAEDRDLQAHADTNPDQPTCAGRAAWSIFL